MRIPASSHHAPRRDKPGSDTARETIRKISSKPASRRSSHPQPGQDRPGARRTPDRALQGLYPDGTGFRHPQVHDPGKIVADLAAVVALGGDCLADIAVLREQPSLAGPVASDPVVSRLVTDRPPPRLDLAVTWAIHPCRASAHHGGRGILG
jgi:hypothetical protein